MERSLTTPIRGDLETKIVLLAGPRQVGKTTVAKAIHTDFEYFNYDHAKDRKVIRDLTWNRKTELVIFDELHKLKNWKQFIKGIYDTEGVRPRILVTGSARLDVARKMGDSLAGRHFYHMLHPLTLRELDDASNIDKNFSKLLDLGGFPEPFLNGEMKYAARWRASHLDIILRQDLLDLENVRQIKNIEILVELLRERVGTPISVNNLSEDLGVDHKTVERWITILSRLFVIFEVFPLSRNIARAIKRQRKIYFYDNGQVIGDKGVQLENLTACALAREVAWETSTQGRKLGLYYIRDKEGREIDFAVKEASRVRLLLEVKWADEDPSRSFRMAESLTPDRAVQIVGCATRTQQIGKTLQIEPAAKWLHSVQL